MSLFFFDASALVKYYATEPGSTWVRRLLEARDLITGDPTHIILVAEISRVEVAAGLAVITRVGRISQWERDREYSRFVSQFIHRYSIIPLTTTDIEVAADLTQRHPLKAYDAVQLAVALRQAQALARRQITLTFVSGDDTLLTAAQAEGLLTDNPFDHVAPQDTPQSPGS